MITVLYISYDGVFEPLGQSQILPYLRRLAALGTALTLVTFEKPRDHSDRARVRALRSELAAQGIRWVPLAYHKRPALLATAFDLLVGLATSVAIALRHRVRIAHSRGYPPALIAWLLKRLLGVRFVFDMRAFWADERAEGGLLARGGAIYRLVKGLERRFLSDADEVVTLTEDARSIVERWPGVTVRHVSVVRTCVDLERFAAPPGPRRTDPWPVFVYAGSIAPWYLPGEMLHLFARARARFPRARFLLITPNRAEAAGALDPWRFGPDAVTLTSAEHGQMPARLAGAHVGLALYRPGPSRRGTAPTKIGEYLATGLPVIVNDAVGDVAEIIGGNSVGAILSRFGADAYDEAIRRLAELWSDPTLPARCRRVAETYFSLEQGVDRYWTIYQRLATAGAASAQGREAWRTR